MKTKPFDAAASVFGEQPFLGSSFTGMARDSNQPPFAAASSAFGQQPFMGIASTGMVNGSDQPLFPDFATLYKSTMNPFGDGTKTAFGTDDFDDKKFAKRRSSNAKDNKEVKSEDKKDFKPEKKNE